MAKEKFIFTEEELKKTYEDNSVGFIALCEVESPIVGGQPASREAIEAYVEHHLGIADPAELEKAVARILDEEVGEREDKGGNEKGEGELDKKLSYGVNVLRKDPLDGCRYIGSWMIKAAIKVAMSRYGIFQKKRGSKGDVAELGSVTAHGISECPAKAIDSSSAKIDPLYAPPHKRVRMMNPDGLPYMGGIYKRIAGHVTTAQGSRSIIQDAEIAPAGTQFEFIFRFKGDKLSVNDMLKVLSSIRVIGLGSARSIGHGEFKIVRAELLNPTGFLGQKAGGGSTKALVPEGSAAPSNEAVPTEARIGDIRPTVGHGVK